MGKIVAVHKFVVDGDYAQQLYDIFRNSYFVKNNWQPFELVHLEIQFNYFDGVLRLEERTTEQLSYLAEILYFFAGRENVFCLSEYIEDGVVLSYNVEDDEGKYFVRPPKTEWELQMEERWNNRKDEDLPF